jgi:pimeloyl-ACP methyl ester carboxylesterase
VYLVGLDIGAILGFRLCLAHPKRVRRFVCLAAPHPYTALPARVLVRVVLKSWRLWPRFATTLPLLGPRLVSRGQQRLPRYMMLGDAAEPNVWSPEDLELYLGRLRDPSRAPAAVALFRALAIRANNRAATGAYRGTRLVTPTLGLYGTVLDDSDRNSSGHPALLRGFEQDADDFTLAHVPGSGYYLAEEQPQAVVRHLLDFLAAS